MMDKEQEMIKDREVMNKARNWASTPVLVSVGVKSAVVIVVIVVMVAAIVSSLAPGGMLCPVRDNSAILPTLNQGTI